MAKPGDTRAAPALRPFWRGVTLRFCRNVDGGAAMLFSLALPMLAGLAGVAVDYSSWSSQKSRLQKAADAAAFAATRELQIGAASESRVDAVAESVVRSQFQVAEGDGAPRVEARIVRQGSGVQVKISQRKDAIMSRLVSPHLTDMEVTATAMMAGGTKVCVVALDEAAADTIRLDNSAQISASGCSVHANSTSPTAMRSEKSAVLRSLRACSSGGYVGGAGNFTPVPLTDCPKTRDPLAERPAPPEGGCLSSKLLKLKKVTRTLDPGTYCGGLVIGKGAKITLNPGVYVIKDGPLVIGPSSGNIENLLEDVVDLADLDDGTPASTGYVRGNGVGFYFTGATKGKVAMRLEKNSLVEITAPKSGPMAGLLFHENRASAPDRRFEILSDTARRLVGTIYLPRGMLTISNNKTVADESEYTAIVVKRLDLSKAPTLVLNTNYTQTDVPVPEGLGPSSGKVRLVE
jgi:hypothetical protein